MNAISRIAFLSFMLFGTNIAWCDVVVPVASVENSVNVRFAPDAKSEVVGQLHKDAALEYIASVDGWHEVALEGGGTGFVSADWSIVLADDEEVAAQAVEETAEETAEDVRADDAVSAEVAEEAADEAIVEPEVTVENVEIDVDAEEATVDEPMADAVVVEPQAETIEPDEKTADAGVAGAPMSFEGSVDYLMKFIAPTEGGVSQVFDNGRNVGIGTSEPQQRLEVNGNIQIHEQNSNVAGLMITQSSGEMGYIMHNRASTLTIGAGSIDRITIDREGNVGFGVNRPAHPVEMASGAHVTAGGVWTNSSSIEKKENVRSLTPEEALAALAGLEPVRFNYKVDDGEDYVGFIAEDVPDLVATSDRTGLSAMDIVAVLTSVVQQQQKKIEALEARLENP